MRPRLNVRRVVHLLLALALGATLVGQSGIVHALTFGLAGKSLSDPNFVVAWQECDKAARAAGDECIHIGAKGAAEPRYQANAIADALSSGALSALAISVTSSNVIARAVEGATIPIITFDSPFGDQEAHLSRAYVGTDNFMFGRELARITKRLHPQGGTVCLMTVEKDPNLMQRMRGVRYELSGDGAGLDKRLSGAGGWTELPRCPWNSADNPTRALNQLAFTLSNLKPDVFISLGHWPVLDTAGYRAVVEPFRARLLGKQPLVIVAVGSITPDYASLLDEQLVHGYVSIDFERIGRECYELMKAAANGERLPAVTHDPATVRVGE